VSSPPDEFVDESPPEEGVDLSSPEEGVESPPEPVEF